jgi:acid phosphatase type 7
MVCSHLIALICLICSLWESYAYVQRKAHHKKKHQDLLNKLGAKVENELAMMSFHPPTSDLSSDYVITDVSPLVIENDGTVRVSYSTVTPDDDDFIAYYSPANVDPTKTSPIKYGYCDEGSLDYVNTGNGTLSFNLTNLRADGRFYYMTGSTSHPVIRAHPDNFNVTFDSFATPLRPRMTPVGISTPREYYLSWSSNDSVAPSVLWGTQSGVYTNTVSASASSITVDQMSGWPANNTGWRELGTILTARLDFSSVTTAKKIYYTFGDEDTQGGRSSEMIFFMPPLAGETRSDRGTRVILYDDLGRGSTDDTYTWDEYGRPAIFTTMAVGDEVIRGEVDAVYHGGDISYATGYMAVWDFFMDQISPIASSTIYLTTVGNHESDCPDSATIYPGSMSRGWGDSGGECGIPATTLLTQPEPAVTDKPWWAYDVGLIHFIGMSTEHDFSIGSEQWNFLKSDLESVNRTLTPWIIFGGHRAMYINSDYLYSDDGSSDEQVMNSLIDNIEPLLVNNSVDLGFYGHNHAVQRHSAVINKTVIQRSSITYDADNNPVYTFDHPGAPVHMVVGTGGAYFSYNAVYSPNNPVWNEAVFYKYGYARVEVTNTTLNWSWVEAETGVVMDRMKIIKNGDTINNDEDAISNDDGSSNEKDERLNTVIIIASTIYSVTVIAGIYLFVHFKGTFQKRSDSMLDDMLLDDSAPRDRKLSRISTIDAPTSLPDRHPRRPNSPQVQSPLTSTSLV